jgi:hypothetical protein
MPSLELPLVLIAILAGTLAVTSAGRGAWVAVAILALTSSALEFSIADPNRIGLILRLSAIQALADTQRAEALTILRQLTAELGRYTALGRAAASTAQHLDAHLAKAVGRQTAAISLGTATPGSL